MIIGIDVGKNGALASSRLNFIDFNLRDYIKFIKDHSPKFAIVEKVHSMPNQGVRSMFSFGQRLGEIEGMLQSLNVPYELVNPKEWQRALHIPPKSSKEFIADTILKLYPRANLIGSRGGLKDGRSDALCLVHYGLLRYKES